MAVRVAPDVAPASGVLSLKDMDPDFNNDGVIDEMEQTVYNKMTVAELQALCGDGGAIQWESFLAAAHFKAPEFINVRAKAAIIEASRLAAESTPLEWSVPRRAEQLD